MDCKTVNRKNSRKNHNTFKRSRILIQNITIFPDFDNTATQNALERKLMVKAPILYLSKNTHIPE